MFWTRSNKHSKVLFAFFRDIWCLSAVRAEWRRSLTLTEKVEKKPTAAVGGFKQIGSTLRDARRSRGWSVRDVSEQLRISVDFLTKLEAGAFNELPAPAYVTGFLRSYGRCVGLAPDMLVARYMAVAEGKDSQQSYNTPMSTRPPQRSAPAVASMLVVFALIAYGGWFWLKTASLPPLDTAETDTKTAALSFSTGHVGSVIGVTSLNLPPEVNLVVEDSAGKVELSSATPSPEKTVEASGSNTDIRRNQLNHKPAMELELNEKAAPEPSEIDSSAGQTGITGQLKTQFLTTRDSASLDLLNGNKAIANLRDPAKEITIRAVAASWVEIVRDNGEEVLAKLMQAGDSYVVEGNTRLFLSTGNAGGLTVVIGTDDPLSMGDVGEIVRDLPLVTDKLRKSL